MGDLSTIQWAGAAFSALLVGLSKAGFGAGAGLLAVPLMAAVLGPGRALGLMLLVLITGDVFSIIHYPRDHDRRALVTLIPGLVAGVAVGYVLLGWFQGLPDSELWLRRLIGFLSVMFVGFQVLRIVRERRLGGGAPYVPKVWHGMGIGVCGGITSTLAHAGGPVIALFLLPQRLEKRVFVGTFVKYFFIGNMVKLVPYALSGLLTREVFLMSLALLPAVVVGTFLGVYLHGKCSDTAFRAIIYVLAVCIGFSLMATGWKKEAPAEGSPGDQKPEALWRQGLDAYARGDFATARDGFGRLLQLSGGGDVRAGFNRALALYKLGRYGEAGVAFAAMASGGTGELRCRAALNAGNCAYRRGRYGEASAWYSRSLALAEQIPSEIGREAGRRAEHNRLRCAAQKEQATVPGTPAGGQVAQSRGAADLASATAQPGSTAAPAAGAPASPGPSATGGGAGPGPGLRPVAALLADVTRRDTGPVLASDGMPAGVPSVGW